MDVFKRVFCLLLLLLFSIPALSCPCFDSGTLYSTFNGKLIVKCRYKVTEDFYGAIPTHIHIVIIRSIHGYALAQLTTGPNAGGVFGQFANGGCEMSYSGNNKFQRYAAPITDQASCTREILEACQRLNIDVK